MAEQTITTGVSFTQEQLHQLDALVFSLKQQGHRHVSRSSIVREALRHYLEQHTANKVATRRGEVAEPPPGGEA